MKIVTPYIELIEQQPGLDGMYKHIETCGRICYKSESNENTTAKDFVERLKKSKHGAMLEHGTVYLDICHGTPFEDKDYMWKSTIIQIFKNNKYSKVNQYYKEHNIENSDQTIKLPHYAITTNWRVICEQIPFDKLGNMRRDKLHGWELGMELDYILSFMCEPNEHHERRFTIKFSSDRGVSAEANRHRAASPAEQSTRYIDFSKDKFNNEIRIAANADISEEDYNKWYNETELSAKFGFNEIFRGMAKNIGEHYDDLFDIIDTWYFVNAACEWGYMRLKKLGWTPQQARRVLPLDLNSEFVHTAFESDWKHFVDLRSIGTTGKPHPDMKLVADKVKEVLMM